jgi:3-dehydroquinate synthase
MLGDISHGEAVGVGLVAASRLSATLGLCDEGLHHRVTSLIRHVGGQTSLPRRADSDAINLAFAHDKKRRGTAQRFVLLEDVGRPIVTTVDDRSAVGEAIATIQPSHERLRLIASGATPEAEPAHGHTAIHTDDT